MEVGAGATLMKSVPGALSTPSSFILPAGQRGRHHGLPISQMKTLRLRKLLRNHTKISQENAEARIQIWVNLSLQ